MRVKSLKNEILIQTSSNCIDELIYRIKALGFVLGVSVVTTFPPVSNILLKYWVPTQVQNGLKYYYDVSPAYIQIFNPVCISAIEFLKANRITLHSLGFEFEKSENNLEHTYKQTLADI